MKDYFSLINYLALEPNSDCNLSCKFCTRTLLAKNGLRPQKNLSINELHFILKKFQSCPIETIKFQGLSEPMFHPHLDQLVFLLKSYFPASTVIISTNLQYKLLETTFLATLPYVDIVYLSIDGTGKIFEDLRKGGSYKKVIENLELLKINLIDSDSQKKLHLNFTLSPKNLTELPKMYLLKEKYNLASVRINLVQNWNENELNQHQFNYQFIEELKKYRSDVKGVPGWDYSSCFWPFSGMIIDVYGNLRQCLLNTTQVPLGNIFNDDIKMIYNEGQHYQELRSKLTKNCPPSSCTTCDYKYLSKPLEKLFNGFENFDKGRSFTKL